MKAKSIVIALFCTIFTMGLWAQKDIKDVANIEVTGTARMDVMPDEIYISINLRERTDGRDKITVEVQETQMKAGLVDLGISLDDLSLSDSESDYVRINWRRREVISNKQYTLKVATAQEVSKVFELLDALKINDAFIARTEHSEIVALRKQLRIDAIKAAKAKADYLLEAIGEKAGHALEIRENNPEYRYMNSNNIQTIATYKGLSEAEEALPEIGFQKIRLESSIYVKFEILQDEE